MTHQADCDADLRRDGCVCYDKLDAAHIPTTPYYDGRDGSLEAEEDDDESIADQEAHREDWQDYLEFQRTSH